MLRPVIQGGMGVYIGTPFLANVISRHGGLGTVSCTAADILLARILQSGDPGGHFRRALAHFPFPEIARSVLVAYFIEGGIPHGQRYKRVPMFTLRPTRSLIALAVCASFAFVWLAKEGHSEPISVNYLEKIQMPHLFHITGAMLAGVDFVTMGAGIPLQIPGVLSALAEGGTPTYRVSVDAADPYTMSFNLREFFGSEMPPLKRPGFLPIISSNVLAEMLLKRCGEGAIYGFPVETPVAGGHNAPPRGKGPLDERGEPVYGPKDAVDFAKLSKLGKPFWIGGAYASPEGLARAKEAGAVGIQTGTIFALSENSGMEPVRRTEIRRQAFRGELYVRTDARASPTGFPFKVVEFAGTMSEGKVYEARPRICDLSALVTPFVRSDGTHGYRCPSEPIDDYVRKGGNREDAEGRKCLCNGLLSAAGYGSPNESPIFTSGDDMSFLRHLMREEYDTYTAVDALAYLLRTPS